MTPPTKFDVLEKLRALTDGTLTREEVAGWAKQWIIDDNPQYMPSEVWSSIKFLCAVDMISTDRPYLYGHEDFENEISRLA